MKQGSVPAPGILKIRFKNTTMLATLKIAIEGNGGKITSLDLDNYDFLVEIEHGKEKEMIKKLSYYRNVLGDILSIEKA